MTSLPRLQRIPLEQLSPDWDNPRFPPGASSRFSTDTDVYVYLDVEFDAFSVADSIAEHGFFESEPLIAMPATGSGFTVLEGNRRLAALQGLVDAEVRAAMKNPGWANLAPTVELPEDLPVLVADSRDAVAPILGYRHITGIAPWSPYQQARFVASLIDEDELDADRVAELIGRSVSEVRAFYRNYSIAEQAEDVFEISDVDRLVQEFGVWTRAMTSAGARDYISAPPPRGVVEREYPLPEDAKPQLENLLDWLFGDPRTDGQREEGLQSREGRAIGDSREITRLGKAIQHPKGLSTLEAGGDLIAAERAMLDTRAQFAGAIEESKQALEVAAEHRPKRVTKSVDADLEQIAEIATRLRRGDGSTD